MDNGSMPSFLKINSKKMKKIFSLAGSTLAMIGIIFIAIRLHGYWRGAHLEKVHTSVWVIIILLALCYSVINIFLALSWRSILLHLNVEVSKAWAVRVYGISQLAKYVPGNIFHLAGRQALSMAAGLPAKKVLTSSLYEQGIIIISGVTAGWIVLSALAPSFPLLMGISLLIISLMILLACLQFFLSKKMAIAGLLQITFLIFSAFIFVAILKNITHAEYLVPDVLFYAGGTYIIAWLAGLITPGAPAGVGVRELVILFCLSNIIPESELLLAVVLGRVVTVIGDVIFYVYAHFIRMKQESL